MTFTFGFYNSVSEDRKYDAIQISRLFDGMINDGVYATIGGYLLVSPNTGMQIKVASGRAWFNHTWNYNDSDMLLTLNNANALNPRWDAIYLEVNEETRTNKIDILTGTPSANPAKPALTNTATIHQYTLANIYVPAAVSSITAQNIYNVVGTNSTPFVTGLLQYVTTNDLLAQWEAEWDYWFNYIMGELDSEVAGNLQNQITAMRGDNNPPLISLLTLKTHDHDNGDGNKISGSGINYQTITDANVGARIIRIQGRAGGHSTIWSTPGNTFYQPELVIELVGSRNAQNSIDSVVFPIAFTYAPVVFIQSTNINIARTAVTAVSTSGFTVRLFDSSGNGVLGTYFWRAVGQAP